MLKSSLFEVIYEVYFGDQYAHAEPSSVGESAYPGPAAFSTPNEWADAKQELALMIRNVMTMQNGDTGDSRANRDKGNKKQRV